MAYDVVIKSVQMQWIASVRETIASYPAVGPLYGKVAAGLGPAMGQAVLPVAIWHDREFKESDVDAEAGFYLREPIPAVEGIQVRQLPSETAASTIHNGSFRRLPEAYDALLRWVGSSGYEIAGPIRELYLHCPPPVRQDDESYVTEIQVPVKKGPAETREP